MKRFKFILLFVTLLLMFISCAPKGTGCPGHAGYKLTAYSGK